jgi:hypothetical protein
VKSSSAEHPRYPVVTGALAFHPLQCVAVHSAVVRFENFRKSAVLAGFSPISQRPSDASVTAAASRSTCRRPLPQKCMKLLVHDRMTQDRSRDF